MAISPELFKRTRYFGSRTSSPSTVGLQIGAWWYRSDIGVFCYWDGTAIQCWGGTGGAIHTGSNTILTTAGGDYVINVTVAGITTINHLIDIQLGTNPDTDPGSPIDPIITGTVVGFTLIGVGSGTTITATVKVLGW